MSITLDTWPTKQGLRIGHLNINRAINKKDEIASILHNNGLGFHLFCFTESHLSAKVSDSDMTIPNYQLLRIDPSKDRPKSTGLLVYYASVLNCNRLIKFEKYGVESIWIQITMKHSKPLLTGFIYRNPSEKVDWKDSFNTLMDDVSLLCFETILMGDFNIDLLKSNRKWEQIYTIHGLEQLADKPTRITENTSTLIDHIYSNSRQSVIEVCSPPCGCSDHNPICLTWHKNRVKIPKVGHKIIYYRSFKNFSEADFLADLAQSHLDNIFQIRDPDLATKLWIDTFVSVYDKHAPFIKKRVKQETKPPWISKDIDKERYKRAQLSHSGTRSEFKKQRNKVNSMIRKSKMTYFRNLVTSTKDSRQIWRAINMLTNKHIAKSQKVITEITPDQFNDHFANIASKVISKDSSEENDLSQLLQYINSKDIKYPFQMEPITTQDVSKSISLLKTSCTRDLDGLDSKILKMAKPIIIDSLTYLYNLCIDKNTFPIKFKEAKVIPLHKSGETSDPSNYRPISILSVLSKPLERHIKTHLYSYLSKNNLLHEDQSGFRKHHSCNTALIQLIDNLLLSINENKFAGILFVDFKKAFDVISHALLLRKLKLYNLPPEFIKFLSSFLSNRKQLTVVNNKTSTPLPIEHGVPQGSVLGPILFSIYVNDLPCHIDSRSEMFADDTSLYDSDFDPSKLSSKLQNSVNSLVTWTYQNHMSLNAVKTKCMFVCARQKRQKMKYPFPPLFIENKEIEQVDSHKILGVMIDKNLTWSEHTTYLGKNISKKVFQLRKIKHLLDKRSRKLFFDGHILSLVDYGSSIWGNSSDTNLKLINRMYKKAIKLILLKSTSLSVNDYKSINSLTLHDRLLFNKGLVMHNVVNGNAPSKIIALFKTNIYRHNHLLSFPRPRNNLFKSSFLYSGGTLWNTLPATLKKIKNKNYFKSRFKIHLLNKQQSYG